ncbi:MAG: nitroreductase family protein [Planctomycetes bacterium]|nr:nitroreductase family protein [Planctomycetota bacterium]
MIPYSLPAQEIEGQVQRGKQLLDAMNGRRSCRFFSDRPIDRRVLELALAIGHSAPSGANRKPWRFVVVDDPALKCEIREAAEKEERESYDHRMPQAWLDALEPLGTNWEKPFLEIAPCLVVLFRIDFEEFDGRKERTYYPAESAGIAAGFFLMACHHLGIATLTHTPSPMTFLRDLLGRPSHEKPFLLIPIGYPAVDCVVPDVSKKPLSRAMQWNRRDASTAPVD